MIESSHYGIKSERSKMPSHRTSKSYAFDSLKPVKIVNAKDV